MTTDWVISLMNLQKPAGTRVHFQRGVPIDVARNTLARSAQERHAAHIFFLDVDVLVPPDTITRLMSWKVPIISGIYWSKKGFPAIWDHHPSGRGFTPMRAWRAGGLTEVAAISMGVSLVDMRVFSVIPEPWFDWTLSDPRREGEGIGQSEDLNFCMKAYQHGLALYADGAVQCLHQTLQALNVEGKPEEKELGAE